MRKLSKFIVNRRKELLLNQAELSRRLGIEHSQQMANIESGRAPFPVKRIKRLAHVLGLKVPVLFGLYMDDLSESLWKEMQKGE